MCALGSKKRNYMYSSKSPSRTPTRIGDTIKWGDGEELTAESLAEPGVVGNQIRRDCSFDGSFGGQSKQSRTRQRCKYVMRCSDTKKLRN